MSEGALVIRAVEIVSIQPALSKASNYGALTYNVKDYQFTAAAQRALEAASNWANDTDHDLISPPQLLLGLLAEAESRAAGLLSARGIDTAAVLARWPGLTWSNNRTGSGGFSAQLRDALAAASSHLADFARPLEFATEHLLLGLVSGENESSAWLSERGLDAKALADDICRRYGYGSVARGPLSVGSGDEAGDVRGPLSHVRCEETALAADEGLASNGRPPVQDRTPRLTGHGPLTTDYGPLRIIDAAANRAREGLRVVEDFVRFVWDDRHLMRQLKALRHDLAAVLAMLDSQDLLGSRDTSGDVGTTVSTAAEQQRPNLASVVTANFKRLQESLRSIEEFGKVIDPEMAKRVEQLRYRGYTLERAVGAASFGLERLANARLYVLIDGRSSLAEFNALAHELIASGVDVLQLRDKKLADTELLSRAQRLRELAAGTRTLFIVNDRPDLAVLAGADGVHVGQEELPVRECRAIVGPRALIGVSTHSLEQARQAVLDGANYIGVGPTFASRTKPFDNSHLRGVELLRTVRAEIGLPAFAIGGIDRTNLHEVLAIGLTRIAVSGAVLSADEPGRAAQQLAAQLAAARQ